LGSPLENGPRIHQNFGIGQQIAARRQRDERQLAASTFLFGIIGLGKK
jgi:hypothetical protein